MKFEGGLDGRPATEFIFLPIDPLVAKGQEEALNPSEFFLFLFLALVLSQSSLTIV